MGNKFQDQIQQAIEDLKPITFMYGQIPVWEIEQVRKVIKELEELKEC